MLRHEWALQDAEADRERSKADLEHEAEATRERVNDAVVELRERLGLDPDAAHAHGPFAPVRRHPYTVVVAAAGVATAAVVGVSIVRGHRNGHRRSPGKVVVLRDSAVGSARRVGKDALKASKRGRKAAGKRLESAKDSVGSAAHAMGVKRRKLMRRLKHH